MYPSLTIIFCVLLPYCAVLSAAASADCFRQEGDSYTTPTNHSDPISVGVTCSTAENKNCTIESGGFLNAQRTLNVNTTDPAEIFDAIGKAVNTDFKEFLYGRVPNVSRTVGPGSNGYIGFTVYLRCYKGVVGDGKDCFDDVPAGVSLTACQPATLSGKDSQGIPDFEGMASFVNTDQETASKITTNPATTATNAPVADDKDSGAVMFGQRGGSLMMMVTTVVVGMGIGSCWFTS